MKNWLFFLISTLVLLAGCNNSNNSPNRKTYEQKVQDVELQEKRNPTQFLQIRGTYKKNLLGETVLEGDIISTATKAKYKDIKIRAQFISKTESVISTNDYIIYDEVGPRETKSFKLKVKAPRPTNSVSMSVVTAK